jgi:hypothetical protein
MFSYLQSRFENDNVARRLKPRFSVHLDWHLNVGSNFDMTSLIEKKQKGSTWIKFKSSENFFIWLSDNSNNDDSSYKWATSQQHKNSKDLNYVLYLC